MPMVTSLSFEVPHTTPALVTLMVRFTDGSRCTWITASAMSSALQSSGPIVPPSFSAVSKVDGRFGTTAERSGATSPRTADKYLLIWEYR